jgi:hypothetical protein
MSVSGIFSSSFSNNQLSSQYRLTNQQFQQLGQDLASGNLSAAQSDFAILQQAFAQPVATTASPASSSSNPLAQAFQQLSTDLKSGNLTAAQKDYSTVQQDLQSQFGSHHLHHHHMRSGGGAEPNSLLQNLNQPGQDPFSPSTQSAAAGTAQQAYTSLQQLFQQAALSDQSSPAIASVASSPVSFLA